MKWNNSELGDSWAPAVMETMAESQALSISLSQESCQECWIRGLFFHQNSTIISGIKSIYIFFNVEALFSVYLP